MYSASEPFTYELTVEKSCEVEISYSFMSYNTIEINGEQLEIDASIPNTTGGSATFTIQIEMVE